MTEGRLAAFSVYFYIHVDDEYLFYIFLDNATSIGWFTL